MKIKVGVIGVKELQKEFKDFAISKASKVKKETYATGIDIQTEAKQRLRKQKAWDTGNLANSIIVDLIEGGFVAEIGPTAPYGLYVEEGTRPHFPPPGALAGWARRHGFSSAWPICKAINERGLPARPYLFPAYLALEKKFFDRLKEILGR